jgi:beta-N-acetylhexosaminidase
MFGTRSNFRNLVLICCAAATAWLALKVAVPNQGDDGDPELRRLYGQLLLVGFVGTTPGDPGVEAAARDLSEGLAGGLIFFDRNIRDAKQLAELTAYFRAAGGLHPPLLAIDEEGGAVQRLRAAKGFRFEPSAHWVGANMTSSQAQSLYGDMAGELSALGLNLNLAPVVDLDAEPGNRVIGRLRRSFGSSPEKVASFAGAFIEAHRENGVLTAIKHWPGHGSSRGDPHYTRAVADGAWQPKERLPFEVLLKASKADIIMSGHLHHDDWATSESLPASLSPRAIETDLRKRLGFAGVVITDDIQMRSALAGRSLAEAVVLALAAGNDIVLIGNMVEYRDDTARQAVDAIEVAVADGRLDLDALEASFRRVTALKARIRR